MKNSWTWPEIIITAIMLPLAFIAALAFLGLVIDKMAEHSEQHDRCMKQATTGYEMERCR